MASGIGILARIVGGSCIMTVGLGWAADAGAPLDGLRAEHPRLLATAEDWRAVRARRAREPDLDAFAAGLVRAARAAAEAPPVERIVTGRRLLSVSREALRRILLHAAAFRLEGDPAFVAAARREMLAAAAFADWNPSHFLDVAEMTAALGIGYDGLHAELDAETRGRVRAAIRDLGLRPALEADPAPGFFTARNNWNQVCLGGLALGALAIAEDEPDLAGRLVAAARANIRHGLSAYAPDGVYPEGPMYWYYGTSYQVLLIEALRTALGTDGDLPRAPGFLASADFLLQMRGPSGRFFGFADSGDRPGLDPTPLWFARERGAPRLGRDTAAALRRAFDGDGGAARRDRLLPLALCWWPAPGAADGAAAPLSWTGGGPNPVAAWRTAWDDPDAVFLAIKAGGANVNHGHMDAGAFVFDAHGRRWAEDLGNQDYHSLERVGVRLWDRGQDAQRWQVFRLNNHSHNTLTVDGALHRADGLATFLRAGADGAELDLTPAFLGAASRVTRTVRWRGAAGVEIEDRLEGLRPGADVRWALVTAADAAVEGDAVRLRQDGRSVRLSFAAEPLRLAVESVERPGGFNAENPDRRRVEAHTAAGADGRAAVRATLSPEPPPPGP